MSMQAVSPGQLAGAPATEDCRAAVRGPSLLPVPALAVQRPRAHRRGWNVERTGSTRCAGWRQSGARAVDALRRPGARLRRDATRRSRPAHGAPWGTGAPRRIGLATLRTPRHSPRDHRLIAPPRAAGFGRGARCPRHARPHDQRSWQGTSVSGTRIHVPPDKGDVRAAEVVSGQPGRGPGRCCPRPRPILAVLGQRGAASGEGRRSGGAQPRGQRSRWSWRWPLGLRLPGQSEWDW